MTKILVTGGAGFIGLHFLEALASAQFEGNRFEVTVLDKLTYASNLPGLLELKGRFDFDFHQVDIADSDQVAGSFGEPDIVVNFAAESHVDNSISNPQIFAISNYVGTSNLLHQAVRANVRKFVQVSTDEVYGSILRGEAAEDFRLQPSSPYSASKAAADLLVGAFRETHGLSTLVTRTCNNFGPRQHVEKFIPTAIAALEAGKPIPVYGDGKNVREWIDVRDNAQAILSLVVREEITGILNIGSGVRLSNLDVASLIVECAGVGDLEFVDDRLGHDRRYAINSTNIKSLLDFSPSRTLEDFIRAEISTRTENKSG